MNLNLSDEWYYQTIHNLYIQYTNDTLQIQWTSWEVLTSSLSQLVYSIEFSLEGRFKICPSFCRRRNTISCTAGKNCVHSPAESTDHDMSLFFSLASQSPLNTGTRAKSTNSPEYKVLGFSPTSSLKFFVWFLANPKCCWSVSSWSGPTGAADSSWWHWLQGPKKESQNVRLKVQVGGPSIRW